MATTPVFVGTPRVANVRINAANTTPDASVTTNITDLVTGASNGTRVERITINHAPSTATTACTAGMIRFYHIVSSTYRLLKQIAVTATTPSASATTWNTEWSRSDGQPLLVLTSGEKLAVATQIAEPFDVSAYVGDF